jgi:hypothetical protein
MIDVIRKSPILREVGFRAVVKEEGGERRRW